MFVDASAIVAILVDEPDRMDLVARLGRASQILTSPLAVFESTLALTRILQCSPAEALHDTSDFLGRSGARTIDITGEIGLGAIDAFIRFGKGRHRAALNMGDCFSYACAKIHRVPLLCKGDDFIHTDIRIA